VELKLNKREIIAEIIQGEFQPKNETGNAWAPSNIALVKYWGKRNVELNLPITSSLSVSLGHLGTSTKIILGDKDAVFLNGKNVLESKFANRLLRYLDNFRQSQNIGFEIHTENNFPTAAGLASSASGFAALVLALNELFGWELSRRDSSILARMGSGSAARSLYPGFVEWHCGEQSDGMDSFAQPLILEWPDLRIGVVTVTEASKPVGSTEGMLRTLDTSMLYKMWPDKVDSDLVAMKWAIEKKDFELLGKTAESNALAMHATMIDAWPPLLYWQPETVAVFNKIWQLRQKGVPVYFTIDAGPNVKLLFLKENASKILKQIKSVEIINPFKK
jgi:diphosphomevalonate decarboxylase